MGFTSRFADTKPSSGDIRSATQQSQQFSTACFEWGGCFGRRGCCRSSRRVWQEIKVEGGFVYPGLGGTTASAAWQHPAGPQQQVRGRGSRDGDLVRVSP